MASWLPSFLSSGSSLPDGTPLRVPTDKVVPVGFFDDTIFFRTFTVYVTFVYDEVLDVDKLHNGMTKLVKKKGWDKLGARLRRSPDGRSLEHHIPTKFDASRPAVGFTSVDHTGVKIDEHPIGSKFPRAPAAASSSKRGAPPHIACDPDTFGPMIYGSGAGRLPVSVSDYLTSDRPQLGLRVVSFADATVVVVHWMHVAMDAMALSSVLRAWRLVLEEEEEEGKDDGDEHDGLPEPLPADEESYPLRDYGMAPTQKHVLEDVHLKMPGMLGWAARNLWGILFGKKECAAMCVPGPFWKALRERAIAELNDSRAGEGEGEGETWVSEGDVLIAWFTRLALLHYPPGTQTAVNIQQVVDLRGRLPSRFPPSPSSPTSSSASAATAGRPFLGNAIAFMVQLMPIADVLAGPLGKVAGQVRGALRAQTTPEQCEAHAALVRQDPVNRAPPFFGESGMHLFIYTNWSKAGLFETDLGAAVKSGGGKGEGGVGKDRASRKESKVVLPRYIQSNQEPYHFPDGIFILGKDAQDNYWISGYRPRGLWSLMEKAIREEWTG